MVAIANELEVVSPKGVLVEDTAAEVPLEDCLRLGPGYTISLGDAVGSEN